VWKLLVERDRAFDQGEFTGEVLLINLRDEDYGRPLNEVRDSFWSAPRLPLLPGGEDDLRRAIYQAVAAKLLRLVDVAGENVAVTSPSEINLNQSGLRLAKAEPVKPKPVEVPGAEEAANDAGSVSGKVIGTTGAGQGGTSSKGGDFTHGTSGGHAEKAVTFTIAGGAGDSTSDGLVQVFLRLYEALDRGDVSWVQGTLTVVIDAQHSHAVTEALAAIGIQATIKDR
jgi:hypothetical protein